jgi:glycerol dehydrogenase
MTSNLRILGAPGRYMQGAGATNHLGTVVSDFGVNCFVVADKIVTDLVGGKISKSFNEADVKHTFGEFLGECTIHEIDRQAAQAKTSLADVVVGMGGGKTIDTAKGVSLRLGLPIIIVPTIASNDSPTSRLIVVYDDQHRLSEVLKLPRNPDVVLVDTAIIASAPPRFIIAGIGDAIAKKFEAEQCALTGAHNFFGGLPTRTALALCDTCYSTIREFGVGAVQAVEQGRVDDSLENTVEAAVLLSGLGFESGGLALAHSLTRGLSAQPDANGALHGEIVAWGLLVQLIAEGRDEPFIEDMVAFYQQIDLPTTLNDLGIQTPNQQAITEIANITHREAPYIVNMAKPLSTNRLAECIETLEKKMAEEPKQS